MNQSCAFTICAKNYIGLAKALEKSLRENNPEMDFFIFVADEFDDGLPPGVSENILIAKDVCGLPSAGWQEMSFKYDIVEFCTSIKPLCMQYVFQKGYEIAMYFDPDILVFSSLFPVVEALQHHAVVVTPHRIDINSDIPCRGGIYNLGFLGVRRGESADRMLRWWGDRLRNFACADPMRGFFTDQKWMDQLSVVLENDELFVSRHAGLNYAPWNFHERQVFKRNWRFFVRFKNAEYGGEFPLVFLHYSAFKYKEICHGNYNHKEVSMVGREEELYELIQIYSKKITESDFLKYLKLEYTYGKFSDGTPIQYVHRRIYMRLHNEGYVLVDPFAAAGVLFRLFRKNRMLSAQMAFNPERITREKIDNLERKVRLLDKMTLALIRVIGYSRFSLLARFMIRYLHLSNRARFLGAEFRKLEVDTF